MTHVHAAAEKNTRNAAVNQNEPEIITSTTYIQLIFTDQKKILVPRRWVRFQRTGQRGRRWFNEFRKESGATITQQAAPCSITARNVH